MESRIGITRSLSDANSISGRAPAHFASNPVFSRAKDQRGSPLSVVKSRLRHPSRRKNNEYRSERITLNVRQ